MKTFSEMHPSRSCDSKQNSIITEKHEIPSPEVNRSEIDSENPNLILYNVEPRLLSLIGVKWAQTSNSHPFRFALIYLHVLFSIELEILNVIFRNEILLV